ncbi:MAG: hypothetical protein KGR26_06925, partial [Cyanobacteria bacterium REEB65]|nr:hypothetical protein [Cyanobacteria bacterium REEB65]
SGAYLSQIGADAQVALLGQAGGSGLSAVLGLHVPGSSSGLAIGSVQPLVGLRGQGLVGPLLGIANLGWYPGVNEMEISAAGVWQLLPLFSPAIEVHLVGGAVQFAALTPEIQARPIPQLGLGLGYQIPFGGIATGQVVAQANLAF